MTSPNGVDAPQDQTTAVIPTTAPSPEGLHRDLRLARATELARSGHHEQARSLLTEPQSPAEFDLLARIHAQRGRYDDAEECWLQAAGAEGDPEAYRAERDRVTKLRNSRIRRPWVRRVLLWLLALLLVAAVVALAVLWSLNRQDDQRRFNALQAQHDQTLAQARRPAPPPVVAGPQLPADLGPSLTAAGGEVRPDGTGLTVALPQAPFGGGGSALTPQASQALTAIGQKLTPLRDTATVRVVGHTVTPRADVGPDPSGAELGFQRAQAAAAVLATSSGIPPQDIQITSAAASDPPYPADADPARNRTVTVDIAPR